MNLEQRVKMLIGGLLIDVQAAQERIEQLEAKIKELETAKAE